MAIALLLSVLSGCGGGGMKLIVGNIIGPAEISELGYGEYSMEATGGTNITYQWFSNPAGAGEFYPLYTPDTRFTASETDVDTPVEIWVVVNSDQEGPVVKKTNITVKVMEGVVVGAIAGPFEVSENSSHSYSIDVSGATESAYEWTTSIPEFCSFETPDAAGTVVNFGDVEVDTVVEINLLVIADGIQPFDRYIAVKIIADIDFFVNGIEGPKFIDEDDSGTFSVEVISDQTPTCLWSCDPPDAGVFNPPDGLSTIFTPVGVYRDTASAISVIVEAAGYEPVQRDYGIVLRNHDNGWAAYWSESSCEDMVIDNMENM